MNRSKQHSRKPSPSTRKAYEIGDSGHDAERRKVEARVQREVQSALDGQMERVMLQAPYGVPGTDFWRDEGHAMTQLLLPVIGAIVRQAVGTATADLDAMMNIGIDRASLEARLARWARTYTFDLIRGVDANTRRSVGEAMANWQIAGGTIDDLRQSLTSTFGANRAVMIAETEVTRAYAAAHRETWEESGVVLAREWRTAMDERVCPICNALNETQARMGKSFAGGIDDPPAHPRCRCWTVPITKWRLR